MAGAIAADVFDRRIKIGYQLHRQHQIGVFTAPVLLAGGMLNPQCQRRRVAAQLHPSGAEGLNRYR